MGRPLKTELKPFAKALRATLKRRGLAHTDFAKRIGIPYYTLQNILYRGTRISTALAQQFERVLGISAATWLALQSEHGTHYTQYGINTISEQ